LAHNGTFQEVAQMKHVLIGLILVVGAPAAHADVREFKCWAGSTEVSCKQLKKGNDYSLSAHGSWLDTTSSVTATSCVTASIISKAGGPLWPRIAVRLQISSACSAGDKRVTLKRPALGGTDSDVIAVTVIN
jgi:hypothetical protein